jgi:pSer/pThr/pTyr-binding forkhead associated (FHA) protein
LANISVFIEGLTPKAKAALKGDLLEITKFPFRVGRESRVPGSPDRPDSRRRPDSVPNNDLYLLELGHVLNVSREHFLIDYRDGGYVLVDRGSACGTLVEGVQVGEKRSGGTVPLHNNDVIIVGTSVSDFIFKFMIRETG